MTVELNPILLWVISALWAVTLLAAGAWCRNIAQRLEAIEEHTRDSAVAAARYEERHAIVHKLATDAHARIDRIDDRLRVLRG